MNIAYVPACSPAIKEDSAFLVAIAVLVVLMAFFGLIDNYALGSTSELFQVQSSVLWGSASIRSAV